MEFLSDRVESECQPRKKIKGQKETQGFVILAGKPLSRGSRKKIVGKRDVEGPQKAQQFK